jgi:hypothetical protein
MVMKFNQDIPPEGGQKTKDSFILSSLAMGMALIASKHALLLVDTEKTESVMTNVILCSGEYCEGELETLTLLQLDDCLVLQVGADIGAITIPYSRNIGANSKVIAYEYQRDLHNILCANLALNRVRNVEVRFIEHKNTSTLAKDISVNQWFGKVAWDIQCGCPYLNLKKIGLIKIDASGNELSAIKNFTQLIIKNRPYLYFKNENLESSYKILKAIKNLNYTFFWDIPFYASEDSFFKCDYGINGVKLVAINILAIPNENELACELFSGKLLQVDDLGWHPLRGLNGGMLSI